MSGACSGVILAGGLSTRMDGKNKAFLEVGGASILERLCDTFKTFFQELLLVSNSPQEYLSWDLAIVTDLFPVRCSLTGIHSGLFHAPTSHAFVAACDMPFLKTEVIEILLRRVEPKWDVIIPVTGKGYEPLCAVYSKRCIKPIERQLKRGKVKIADFFSHVKVREVPEVELLQADPDLVSFFNVNRPEDLARLDQSAGKPPEEEH
jgi:molybdopterin-guanine dinucleotide biosynthesis protein A